jgi:hypothetical protein
MSNTTDADLLRRVLDRDTEICETDNDRALYVNEREAFISMLTQVERYELTAKQRSWLEAAAVRLGVLDVAPAANVFSSLPPAEQQRHKERAASVVLPWERPGFRRALKPPGRM